MHFFENKKHSLLNKSDFLAPLSGKLLLYSNGLKDASFFGMTAKKRICHAEE
jgi:hypothetical protein